MLLQLTFIFGVSNNPTDFGLIHLFFSFSPKKTIYSFFRLALKNEMICEISCFHKKIWLESVANVFNFCANNLIVKLEGVFF